MPVTRARPRPPHRPKLVDLSALSPKSLNDLIPSEAETRRIKASLANALSELDQLESNISLTQRKLASFSARRAQLLDQTERYRVALAPHKRLPPEILIEIFLACLPQSVQLPPCIDDAPLCLTRICSSWRSLALNAQELWNHFQVVLSARPLRNHHALLACGVWLTRCPDRALSLSITTAPRAPFPLPSLDDRAILPVDLIVPYTRRIRTLEMQNISGEQMDSLVSLPVGAFPILEEMDVFLRDSWMYRSVHDPPIMAFRGACNLRSVTLRGFDGTFNPGMLNLPWEQLTTLNLDTLPSDLVGCHAMLRLCEKLEEVCVRIMRIEETMVRVFVGSAAVNAKTRLGRLKKLEVRFESGDWYELFLEPFEVPRLELLKTRFDWRGAVSSLTPTTSVRRAANPYIELVERSACLIRVLHVGRNYPEFDVEELLAVSPALQELYLQDYIIVPLRAWERIGKREIGRWLERMMVSVRDVDPVLGMLEERCGSSSSSSSSSSDDEGGAVFREIKLGCPKMSFQQRWRMECLEKKTGVRIGLCHYGFVG